VNSRNKKSDKRIQVSHIFDNLRNKICLLEYTPGTVLREEELAREFGMSRTPIREVLHQLAFAGLVESRNGVGTIVTDMDASMLKEIYALRLRIAMLIGEFSAKACKPRHIKATEKLLQRAVALREIFEIKEYWMINHELHFIISDLISNEPLREIWDRLYFQTARFWYSVARNEPQDVTASLCQEIDDVLKALRENDIMAIGFIKRNYIASGLRKMSEHFKDMRVAK